LFQQLIILPYNTRIEPNDTDVVSSRWLLVALGATFLKRVERVLSTCCYDHYRVLLFALMQPKGQYPVRSLPQCARERVLCAVPFVPYCCCFCCWYRQGGMLGTVAAMTSSSSPDGYAATASERALRKHQPRQSQHGHGCIAAENDDGGRR
jgi:hypothetical protein